MITEDDDDTHYCLKCHTTISGIDSYVSHRKSGCGAPNPSDIKARPLSPLMPADEQDFALKADDFFSLLELQSSNKKTSVQVSTTSKPNSGVLTRSKATAVIQASNISKESSASDWIGGHQLRELGNEDNQTKLINAVDNISGNHIKKEVPTQLPYEEDLEEESNDEYDEEDEDFEEVECHNAPPRSHTGGKWKPTTSPIQWLRPSPSHSHDVRTDWNSPPPSHTGGKWKPMLPTHTEGDDDEDKDVPPPGHTKGKWIPGRRSTEASNQVSDEIPPLRKSSGMVQYWCGPCNRRLASKIVYERHLKSDLHFKRTFHEREFENLNQKAAPRKRSEGKRKVKKPDRFWTETDNTPVKPKTVEEQNEKKRYKKFSFVKCDVCRLKVFTHLMGKHLISHYHCRKRHTAKAIAERMALENILSIAQQAPFQCAACRFFCNKESDFLLHWRSPDHMDTMKNNSGSFFCSFCKFECGTNSTMDDHLLSENHREVVAVINRSVPIIIRKIMPVICSTCGWRFRYNIELRKHCLKENHVLTATSTDKYQGKHRCPLCTMVLKSNVSLQRHLHLRHGKSYFYCTICSLTFNTYTESKLHRKTQEHKYTVLERNYQKGLDNKDITRSCQYCHLKFAHALYLKNHLRTKHPEHAHSCPHCGLKFLFSQEVTRHVKAKECNFDSTPSAAYFSCKKCPYKTNSEADYLFHDTLHNEPEAIFETDNQEGGVTSKKSPVLQYKCPVCSKFFKKVSLRCHLRLHTNERPYKCQLCKLAYARRNNLMDHMKLQHADEYWKMKGIDNNESLEEKDETVKFRCSICTHVYAQKDELEDHMRVIHKMKKLKTSSTTVDDTRDKTFLCSFCGKSFLKKFTLTQHAKVHTGKKVACPHTGCVFRARSTAELQSHLATHSDLRPFACTRCPYRTKTKPQLVRHSRMHDGPQAKKYTCLFCPFATRIATHLKRHMRLHTGAKPYSCPYCHYSCNNLENLRKHILLTNKHPGKCVYECRFCEEEATAATPYATNFAREFRVHLSEMHTDRFESMNEAAAYVLGIYSAEEDSKLVQAPATGQPPTPSHSKHTSKNKTSKDNKATVNRKDSPQIEALGGDLAMSSVTSSTSHTSSTVLLTSAADQDTGQRATVDSELLSMVVVANPRDDVVYVEVPSAGTDAWTMEGYYDVEESGTLVPFHSEDEGLLAENFGDDAH